MKTGFDHVCVIGLGYVGLPTAAILASRGVRVTGVDVNENTVSTINRGEAHIVEPDLDILVKGAVMAGRLKAVSAPVEADAFIIAVPTPFTEDNKPDISYVRTATETLAPVLKKGDLVVVESTSPAGTTKNVSKWLGALRPDLSFPHGDAGNANVFVAHSPERVLPGRVLLELVRNDRVVGGLSPRCSQRTAELYGLFIDGECLLTDATTAELVKLAENAFRDVNIAFANELSLVCEKLGVDVWKAVELANRHPRVNILNPGPGVGGHCIAVDPWFIVDSAPDETPLIQAARAVNDAKPGAVAKAVIEAASQRPGQPIACLGLSYKADIDDLRESPAIEIVKHLAKRWTGDILVVEPHVDTLPESLSGLSGLSLVDLDEALEKAGTVALLVDHQPFKTLERSRISDIAVIDTRGIWR